LQEPASTARIDRLRPSFLRAIPSSARELVDGSIADLRRAFRQGRADQAFKEQFSHGGVPWAGLEQFSV
jgi:hypothetical protein